MTVTTATSPATPQTAARWVVPFSEGRASDKYLLGGKGANLCEMTYIGLPVPPGFIITTDACRAYLEHGAVPETLYDQVMVALADVEQRMGLRLGDQQRPLLFSLRSGAPFSMPGMMDTVLNLGAMPETVPGLISLTGDPKHAWDSVRRFAEMFGKVVLGVDEHVYTEALEAAIAEAGVANEREMTAEQLEAVARGHLAATEAAGATIPDDPHEQLRLGIEAVFRSWDGKRARAYRKVEGIPDDLGTAVNVQVMVAGNLGDDSATGVAFTRDPATGEPVPYGDWLQGAQGEDVVAGIRHPEPLHTMHDAFPEAARELDEHLATLERHYRDLCDIEFTIERGTLWMLQTRVGKRSATAALRMAVDMVDEGLIDEAEAVRRVRPEQLEALLHPRFAEVPGRVGDPDSPRLLTTGLAASPGAAVGHITLTADDAVRRAAAGQEVLLVRPETSPDDLEGMVASQGLLTSRGGLVSHAAVVARGFGIPAVCGAADLDIDLKAGTVTVDDVVLRDGDLVSIDGSSGMVVAGAMELVPADDDPRLERLLVWADARRRLRVRANADTADDARRSRQAGAEGIGLCRTEHQFMGERLPLVQQVILSEDEAEEREALVALEARQVKDFTDLLEVMDGLPVVVRLLDPPLHEFLPDLDDLLVADARGELDQKGEKLLAAAQKHREHDPMMGTRGIRLGVLRPALYRTQVRALTTAAAARRQAGGDPHVEVMFPLISTLAELIWAVQLVRDEVAAVTADLGVEVEVTVATMVETPRAALRAGDLAPHVDAFSFGTNDLTQMTFGLSRDDVAGRLMPRELELGLLPADPFRTIDPVVVGELVRQATEAGRASNPELTVGICGEHGGDPASIKLMHTYGLDYVSCSPARLPIARLAAAHAALEISGPSDDA
jgi:pyruvate, orthophosphate dikinase